MYSYVRNDPINRFDVFGFETCVLVTRGDLTGIADHASLYTSRGGDNGEPTLYDPSGSYARYIDPNGGDLLTGDDADIGKYSEFYENLDNSSTDLVCKDTSPKLEKDFFEKSINIGAGSGPVCADSVSTVISGSSAFPNVEQHTFFPSRLFNDAGGNSSSGTGGGW